MQNTEGPKDNRIPDVMRDFVALDAPGSHDIAFLAFEDWFGRNERAAKDWIIVARSQRTEHQGVVEDLFTFSALASVGDDNGAQIVASHEWDVRMSTFGHPIINAFPDGAIDYDPGTCEEIHGIDFRPFVIYRHFSNYIPDAFELVQSFLLYHNAFRKAGSGEYQRLDDNGETHPVAKIVQREDCLLILVDTHHLRDYLAANKSYLVRYHDHKRWMSADVGAQLAEPTMRRDVRDSNSHFQLVVTTEVSHPNYHSLGILLGKDLVLPYSAPDKWHTPFIDDDGDQAEMFVIGRDDAGNEVAATCQEESLSNYFTDKGTPHFLTPVFFRKQVLAKYYHEPSRYTVEDSVVRCLGLWHLPIDVTDEDLVQVWLGDLGRIPFKEQQYWRHYNVAPRGRISEHRWRRDFLAEFAEPMNDPVRTFKRSFERVQRQAQASAGAELFLKLDPNDQHAYDTLHLPVTEEWNEFEGQVQALAKVTIDSLNVQLLEDLSGQRIDGNAIKGSLDLLDTCLSSRGWTEVMHTQVVDALRMIQALRSSGAAHRKGKNFSAALKRYKMEETTNRERIRKLIEEATKAIIVLTTLFETNAT